MQEFHLARAKALLAYAEEIVDEDAARAAVANVAESLNARFGDPDEQHLPLVLGVMGGAVVFTGQLLPQLRFALEFDYIHVTRYDDESGGRAKWKVIPRPNVAGRTIVLLDDVLDAGETLATVKRRLLEMGAAEVVIAVFADKAHQRAKPVKADIVGVTIPNQFVVGFGMDVDGLLAQPAGLVGDPERGFEAAGWVRAPAGTTGVITSFRRRPEPIPSGRFCTLASSYLAKPSLQRRY